MEETIITERSEVSAERAELHYSNGTASGGNNHRPDETKPQPKVTFKDPQQVATAPPVTTTATAPRSIAHDHYNQSFKSRFSKLHRTIEDLAAKNKDLSNSDSIKAIEDIDFVFVVEKVQSESIPLRFANWIAKLRHRSPITRDDIASARLEYIKGLESTYKIKCSVVETDDRFYYLIQLSFYHLGLMLELLGYQWALRGAFNQRKIYKTFYFMKRGVERYQEYQNCSSREDFAARWRYDLAYYFLVGAHVKMPVCNHWRNALKESFKRQKSKLKGQNALAEDNAENPESVEATTKKEKGYSLMTALSDGLFDDWMVLHDKSHKEDVKEVNSLYRKASNVGNCCSRGCASCFFPTITCQCAQVRTETLDREFPKKKGRGVFLTTLCSVWRVFWYGNLVDSIDLQPRTLEDGRKENTREYIGRVGTFRNSFLLHSKDSPSEEKIANLRHILPIERLNNYFGEKIGFYFSWVELFIISMLIPALLGTVMFLIGVVYYSIDVWRTEDDDELADDYISYIFAKACDNYATPAFAGMMVIWGTTFYELWVRRAKWFAFFWRVENLERTELERPPVYSFNFAAKLRKSRIGRPLMYLPSTFFTLFFIGLVFLSVYFINVMNIFSITYCPKPRHVNGTWTSDPSQSTNVDGLICNLFAAAQVLANSLSMFILDALFTRLCYPLTDFEGHPTQSRYTNALILKLFTFRFFNYYFVLFYIAFGIATNSVQYPTEITAGRRYDYTHYGCGQQPCMALLSRQLLSVIVTQPFLNSIIDVTMPILKFIIVSLKQVKNAKRKVVPEDRKRAEEHQEALGKELEGQYKMMELSTLDRREFTAEEFTDKLIVYGALVMFSVALPPAPALALFIIRIDLNLDLGRIMTEFRRPIPLRAQDIGMWGNIMNFLTFAGIITNPLIVILTSSWGSRFDWWSKFMLFLGFEHIVFAVRMLIAFAVADIPRRLIREQQKHKIDKEEAQSNMIREMTESAINNHHNQQKHK